MNERCKNMVCVGEDRAGDIFWCRVCGVLRSDAAPAQESTPEFISDSGRPCDPEPE
jgi:hypothetical protein